MQRLLIPFSIGESWVAIDAASVQEILGPQDWVPLPGAQEELPGVMAWRGRAVAVCDVGTLFGLNGSGTQKRNRTLVVQLLGHVIALPVDAVREVHAVEDNAVVAARATQHVLAPLQATIGESVVPLLDLTAFVSRAAGES